MGGPERRTDIVTLANGFEERNSPWLHSRRHYDAGVGLRSLDDVASLVAFFEGRGGQLHGFRWKDWADFKSCLPSGTPDFRDQQIGRGDGQSLSFPLRKMYRSGPAEYSRPVVKPVAGTVKVGVDGIELEMGADFTVDLSIGTVTLPIALEDGASITAGFEFDVPVRFATDRIVVSAESFHAGEMPQVPVVEVRL